MLGLIMPLQPPNLNSRYRQGYYKPANPKKFVNPDQIIYRSGLELRFFQWCDKHPDIILVASEEIKIPYLNPTTRKFNMYYPDCLIKTRQKKTFLVEIKPFSQCSPPNINKGKKKTKRLIKEAETYSINEAKWAAADSWAKDRGIIFKIFTEKEIDGKK